MRVIAGTARSLPLKSVEGNSTRPTTDRIKETLFNILMPYLYECSFLDLFCGSGAIGIEALSRGAGEAVFVDNNRKAIECTKENLSFTRLSQKARVCGGDVLGMLPQLEGHGAFDLIFMDPPYDNGLEHSVLQQLRHSALADSDTLIVIEASLNTDFSYVESFGFVIVKEKKYKTNQHVFLRKENQ